MLWGRVLVVLNPPQGWGESVRPRSPVAAAFAARPTTSTWIAAAEGAPLPQVFFRKQRCSVYICLASTGVLEHLQMGEGWLIDSDNHWIWRFHRDEKAWIRDPKVFVDRGRQMPDGPPLLKERRYLRKEAADQLWNSLQSQGWKRLKVPAWGEAVEV